jgi:uncharacterized protein
MTETAIVAPTAASERIGEVDVIRGFALFGVLWMNFVFHAETAIPAKVIAALPTAAIDKWIEPLGAWLAEGKAQCLFSLLFGFGFAILSERAEARGVDARALYLRRLLILLAVGIADMALLWMGDILHAYALMGLLLMLTRRWPGGLLLGVGLVLALGAFPAVAAWYVATTPPGQAPAVFALQAAGVTRRWAVFQGHDYVAFVREVVLSWGPEWYFSLMGGAFMATILGRFLIGSWIFRQGWLQDTEHHAALFRRAAPWLLGAGLILAAVGPALELAGVRLPRPVRPITSLIGEAAQLVLALGYAAGLVVLLRRPVWHRALSGLGAVGQMALTNYLTQSLVYVFVLYGFGLGWLKYAGPTFSLVAALVIFAGQILFSRWWLARYRFGPAEWVWRSATYGRWQPLSLKSAVVA